MLDLKTRWRIWRTVRLGQMQYWPVRALTNVGFRTTVATIAIAAATIAYTHYAKKQWTTMENQLKEMHSGGVDTHNLARSTHDLAIAAGQQADAAGKQAAAGLTSFAPARSK